MAAVTKPIVTDETAQEMLAELKKITNAVKRITLTITMKTVNDTPVTDEYVVVTNTATGTVLGRIQYNGQPVAIEVNQDTEYAVTGTQNSISTTGFYAPSTVTGIAQSDTNITIEYLEVSDMSSLEAVRIAIAQHPGEAALPRGTKITINGRVYTLMDYGYPTLEDGTQPWGALFWCVTPAIGYEHDAAETEQATEEYALSDVYYYGKSGSNYSLLALNPGDLIPYSDYDAIYHNSIQDADASMVKNGCCLYKLSAVRRYINSDADYGNWWQATHIGDSKPSKADTSQGWLYNLSAVDKNAIAKVRVRSYNPYTEQMDEMYDKVFLPSVTELYGIADHDEGTPMALILETKSESQVLPTNGACNNRNISTFGSPTDFGDGNGIITRTYGTKQSPYALGNRQTRYGSSGGLGTNSGVPGLLYWGNLGGRYSQTSRVWICPAFWLC